MKDYTKITVLENDKQIKAIFGKDLPQFEKHNPFPYKPSVGYYEPNTIKFNVGVVFNTPSGRDSKVYNLNNGHIRIKETKISGECEWVSDNDTPKKVLNKVQDIFYGLEFQFKGTPLKKKYDNGIKYLVVSSGNGNIKSYKLSLDDL